MKSEALSNVIPYRSFIGSGLVDLREAGILQGHYLIGPSPDSCDPRTLLDFAEQVGRAPVHFRTGDSIQIVVDRTPAPPPPLLDHSHPAAAMVAAELRARFDAEEHWISPTRLYLSHQYAAPVSRWMHEFLLASSAPQTISGHGLLKQHALGRFDAFRDAVQDAVVLRKMTNAEMYHDLLHCITYRDEPTILPDPHVRLNQAMAYCRQINGLYPVINGWHLRPLVITQYPNPTLPQMLTILLEHPGHLTLSMRYRCWSAYDAQAAFERDKPLWRQTFVGDWMKIARKMTGGHSNAVEDEAAEQIGEIDEAIVASQKGESFGTTSCVVIVRDRDPDEADERVHDLLGILAGRGIQAVLEDIGAEKAIRTTWPGHLLMDKDKYQANRHKLPMTGQNFFDVAFPRKLWEGEPIITSSLYPANTPTPMVCSGTAGEPFYYPLHDPTEVPHFMAVGTTGSGKSTWLNHFISALLSIPGVRVILMDSSLARSSYVFSQLIDAEYHEVGSTGAVPLCPLALLGESTDQNNMGINYLMSWFERLFFRRKAFELDEAGSKDLRNALMDVRMHKRPAVDYMLNGEMVVNNHGRHLADLYAALPAGNEQRQRMRAIINELIESYGYIFGGEPTNMGNRQVTVYQLTNLNEAPKYVSTPAKELILHNTITKLDGSPAFCIWDEFWDAIGDDTSAEWFFGAVRTMRGLNCAFGGATQSSTDITDSKYCNVLLGNIPIRLFFPDTSASTTFIAQSLSKLGLNAHEIGRIANASRGEFFYKSPGGARLASNLLGPIGQAICGQTSLQAGTVMRQMLREFGRDDLLERWLEGCGVKSNTDISKAA